MNIFLKSVIIINIFLNMLNVHETCGAIINKLPNDTIKTILNLDIKTNLLLKGLSNLDVLSLNHDTLFIVNKNKIIKINLKNSLITTNLNVNNFLHFQANKSLNVQQLVIKDNLLYMSFFNKIYKLNYEGKPSIIFNNPDNIFFFNVMDQHILLASTDTIKLINKFGKLISYFPFLLTNNGFINNTDGIYYQGTKEEQLNVFISSHDKISHKEFEKYNLKSIKDPEISYVSNDMYFVFDYYKRDFLYCFDNIGNSWNLLKSINLKPIKYNPSLSEIMKEEGYPNFKILYNDGFIYIITLLKSKLVISSINWPL